MRVTYVVSGVENIQTLLSFLINFKDPEDDIVYFIDPFTIVLDLIKILDKFPQVQRIWHKDVDMKKCTGDYIFCIHSQECPDEHFVKHFKEWIEKNPSDIFCVPRVNIVHGYCHGMIKRYGYIRDERGWVNWPDYQDRIFKKHIKSHQPVITRFPSEPTYALWCVTNAQFLR